jgi:hypothetical protein
VTIGSAAGGQKQKQNRYRPQGVNIRNRLQATIGSAAGGKNRTALAVKGSQTWVEQSVTHGQQKIPQRTT